MSNDEESFAIFSIRVHSRDSRAQASAAAKPLRVIRGHGLWDFTLGIWTYWMKNYYLFIIRDICVIRGS
jgi:hypothetical protein